MDEALAQELRIQLKPARGPAPKVEHVCAALLVARDGLSAFKACQEVAGVPEGAHDRVAKLAIRVRELLSVDIDAPAEIVHSVPPEVPEKSSSRLARSSERLPRPDASQFDSQEAFEDAMVEYADTRDARRQQARAQYEATRRAAIKHGPDADKLAEINADRMRALRRLMRQRAEQGDATAKVALENEAVRSAARRRTPAGAQDVLRRREREALLYRLDVQEMLAEKVAKVLSEANFHRTSLDSSHWWDEKLIRAVGAFIASHPPDGTVEWQHDCMRAAMDAPPTLHTAARLPRDVRIGAARCLAVMIASHEHVLYNWVPPDAKQHPWSELYARALGDPVCTLAQRQARGLCVCHCKVPDSNHSAGGHILECAGGRPVCLYHQQLL